jgi:hypothetical protein
MDVNAMDGTYLDYVKAEEVPLGKEPNALADHTDQETTSPKTGDAAAIERVKGVAKDLIDAGNTYWAREILTALEPGSVDDHG